MGDATESLDLAGHLALGEPALPSIAPHGPRSRPASAPGVPVGSHRRIWTQRREPSTGWKSERKRSQSAPRRRPPRSRRRGTRAGRRWCRRRRVGGRPRRHGTCICGTPEPLRRAGKMRPPGRGRSPASWRSMGTSLEVGPGPGVKGPGADQERRSSPKHHFACRPLERDRPTLRPHEHTPAIPLRRPRHAPLDSVLADARAEAASYEQPLREFERELDDAAASWKAPSSCSVAGAPQGRLRAVASGLRRPGGRGHGPPP